MFKRYESHFCSRCWTKQWVNSKKSTAWHHDSKINSPIALRIFTATVYVCVRTLFSFCSFQFFFVFIASRFWLQFEFWCSTPSKFALSHASLKFPYFQLFFILVLLLLLLHTSCVKSARHVPFACEVMNYVKLCMNISHIKWISIEFRTSRPISCQYQEIDDQIKILLFLFFWPGKKWIWSFLCRWIWRNERSHKLLIHI